MYKTTLDNSPMIEVSSKTGKTFNYSTNGTIANPLEATFAAINGCAGVYAKKACSQLGISAEGITIETIPKKTNHNELQLFGVNAILTKINFPATFNENQKKQIITSINQCAVKEIIKNGNLFDFEVETN